MISEATKTQDSYQSAFAELQARDQSQPSWLTRLRAAAMDRFEALGFPTVTEEEWKYTNVAAIARTPFSVTTTTKTPSLDLGAAAYLEATNSRVVFVDGVFSPDLSSLSELPNGAVTDFAEALNDDTLVELMREYLGRVVDYSENGFTALNTALISDGAVIRIPASKHLEAPLQLLFISTAKSDRAATFPRVFIVGEENSSATIIESYTKSGDGAYLTNAVVEIVLKAGAKLKHYRVQDESHEAFHVGTTRAELARDSSFDTTSISLGSKLARHNISVIMDDEGAACRVDGLYITGADQHTDTHSLIDHKRPHCTSRQLYKGILDGKSRAVFNGKVFVRHGAFATDAQQTNKNLLLSKEAHVDTKPQLEIFADDVKCAHGAAIGQLDEDELFYLESRGIHTELARSLLTYGFAEEVISGITVESIKTQLDQAVLNRLHARLEA